MFGFEEVHLHLSFNLLFFIAALLFFIIYTFFIYRYTVPLISTSKRYLLIFLRALALLLLLFLIFEPVMTLAEKTEIKPLNLLFIDDSKSITIDDGTDRKENVKKFLNSYREANLDEISALYGFGSDVTERSFDSSNDFLFSGGSTNFAEIFSGLENERGNISSVVIVSDGVVNEGSNPVFTAKKLNIPVFTVGVGDSSARNDISIRNVLFNEFIYAETPTTILASLSNTGFEGENISVSLYENRKLVEQKNVLLDSRGNQSVEFTYTPASGGEKKMTVTASGRPGEFTAANNKKVFYINITDNKLNVVFIAGSPSADLSFLKNSLSQDENLTIKSITQAGPGKFLENNNREKVIDSADIFFLVGFPSKETPDALLRQVSEQLNVKHKPFFLTFSPGADLNRIKSLGNELSFIITSAGTRFLEVQPYVTADQSRNALLQDNSENPVGAWNNLPPVFQPDLKLNVKPEAEVSVRIKMNGAPLPLPLIVTRRLGNSRSITLLAGDFWRWKLQTAAKETPLFDAFIKNSVRWLNTSEEQKQVSIKTTKKTYSTGEKVEFTAQVYDETSNPVADAEIRVKIKRDGETFDINLNSLGRGLYEGVFEINKPGDYSFAGDAFDGRKKIGSDRGTFNIGEMDIEMTESRMNYEFLSSIADQTGGKYFDISSSDELFPLIRDLNERSSGEKLEITEINLWSNEWLMVIVIILLGIEWFYRKRSGML